MLIYGKINKRTVPRRHQMEKKSALLALCAGNSPVTGEFPTQRPVTRSFDVSFDLCVNKRLSKRSWGWWFETPSCLLWRHCNGVMCIFTLICLVTWSQQTMLSRVQLALVDPNSRYSNCRIQKWGHVLVWSHAAVLWDSPSKYRDIKWVVWSSQISIVPVIGGDRVYHRCGIYDFGNIIYVYIYI